MHVPTRIGRYDVIRILGRGGTGIVYLAEDPASESKVAVKTLLGTGGSSRRRLQREFRVMARLEHPGLVRVFDYGTDSSAPFFVMEYVEGPNVRDAAGSPLPDDPGELERRGRVVRQLRKLCTALAYVHRCGIVHRDLKPSNVLVNRNGQPKLMDFGLVQAEMATATLTQEGAIVGTAAYMAPEQVLGRKTDQRADLYAFGILLYELLAGQPPFSGQQPMQILWSQLHKPPPRPSEVVSGISPELETLILRCLEKDPANRYQRAEDIERALANCPEGESRGEEEAEVPLPRDAPQLNDFLYDPELAGRMQELGILRRHFETLLVGRGSVLAIGGESGAGKTRLVEEFLEEVARQKVFILRGCSTEDAHFPFEAFHGPLQTIATEARRLGPDFVEQVIGKRGGVLRRISPRLGLLPSVRKQPEPYPLDPEQEKLRQFDYIGLTLRSMGELNPVILFLDDFQWADRLSFQCLTHLVQSFLTQQPAARFMVVFTYRDDDLHGGHPLQRMMGSLQKTGRFHKILLQRLEVEEVAKMVQSMLGMAEAPLLFATRLHEETEGNPFFVQEILKSLLEVGLLKRRPDGQWELELSASAPTNPTMSTYRKIPLPNTIRELVLRRVENLSKGAQEVLRKASVIGDELSFEALLGILGEEEERLLDILDELLKAKILSEVIQNEESYRFHHSKIREVLHETLPAPRRKILHRRVAAFLESTRREADRGAAGIAYHHWMGGNAKDAVRWHLKAAEEAEKLGAYAEALDQCKAALFVAGELEEETPWTLIAHLRRGTLHCRIGQLDEAQVDLETAFTLSKRDDQSRFLYKIHSQLSYLHYLRGNPDETMHHANLAWEAAKMSEEPAVRAGAENSLGIAWGSSGHFEKAIEHYERAAGIAEEISDLAGMAVHLSNIAINYNLLGRNQEALSTFRRGLALARNERVRELECNILGNMGNLFLELKNYDSAEEAFGESLDIAQPLELRRDIAGAELGLGEVALRKQRFSRAQRHARMAHDLASQAGHKPTLGEALGLMARVAAKTPRRREADAPPEAHFEHAIDLLRQTGERNLLAENLLAYGRYFESQGKRDLAKPLIAEAVSLFKSLLMAGKLRRLGIAPDS